MVYSGWTTLASHTNGVKWLNDSSKPHQWCTVVEWPLSVCLVVRASPQIQETQSYKHFWCFIHASLLKDASTTSPGSWVSCTYVRTYKPLVWVQSASCKHDVQVPWLGLSMVWDIISPTLCFCRTIVEPNNHFCCTEQRQMIVCTQQMQVCAWSFRSLSNHFVPRPSWHAYSTSVVQLFP